MARQRHKKRARYLAGKVPVIETGRLLSLEQVPTVGLRLMENARSLRRGFCRVNRRQGAGGGIEKFFSEGSGRGYGQAPRQEMRGPHAPCRGQARAYNDNAIL
ncbi:hypothetical protein C1Y31_30340 [Pseudomonas sp. FW305-25]|nr:hypothetical protein C1Y31_30340 [Pseudomonas sp. FW305-25]PMY60648.1 hypothetical protein C1Y32_31075 [Pseudomonas sp. FW126-L8]PNA71060.1 hypothetical protein C1Y33_29585 [Pseudomonas sp. FW305-76]